MILVYAPKSTSRLRYSMRLMLHELLGLVFNITTNPDEFLAYAGAKFTYGKTQGSDHLHFAAPDLLFKTGIRDPNLQLADYQGSKVLFPVFERNAALPYDPFAAAFFMVTRYEEYMPYRKDEYGRFTAPESLAHKSGFLHKPVVNIWAKELGNVLQNRFSGLKIKKQQYRFLPTYDIDQAWSYQGKGFARTTGAYLRALFSGNFQEVVTRTRVISGFETDPFDTFDYQLDLQKKYGLRPIYFFLFAKYGEYDKNIPTTNFRFRQLIKRLADYADAGIHPSYASNQQPENLSWELAELTRVLNKEIVRSRQHFLKLHLPETYRTLADNGITMDYTMGFAALPGFRAGICTPYMFYDIDLETPVPIVITPFAVMDGTLCDYMKLSPDAAIETIHNLIGEVKAVGGTFSSLWHNDSLSETGRWAGWRKVYDELVKKATE